MPLVLADRVRDTTTTTGTGTVTLSGTAPTGYQNFSVIGNGNTTYYTINAGSQWEVGIGTYSSTGPTLARNTVLESSNGNALVDFAAGTKDVFVTYPSDRSVYQDGASIAAGTAVLPVANGGTGVTTSTGTGSVVLSNSPTLVTPVLGAASATSIANALGAVGTPSYTFTGDLNTGIYSPAADTLAFVEGGVEVMRITSGGLVQINTTSGAGWLNVNSSSGAAALLLTNSANSNPFLQFANGSFIQGIGAAGSEELRFRAGGTTGSLLFDTNSSERMRITAAGNVGIGTNSPTTPLSVNGAISASLGAVGAPSYTFIGDLNTGIFSPAADTLAFVEGGVEAMRIDSSARVGIGTSSPARPLDVNGAIRVANASNIEWGGDSYYINGNTAGSLTFGTAGSDRMAITSTGSVGVGVASPGTTFDVALSTSGFPGLRASRSAVPAQYIQMDIGQGAAGRLFATGTNKSLEIINNNTNAAAGTTLDSIVFRVPSAVANTTVIAMYLESSTANVGIGTTAPAGRVHATNTYTNTSNTNFIADGNIPGLNLRPANGRFSLLASYGAANTSSIVLGTGTANPSTEAMRFDHSTGGINVGAATPNAAAQLQVDSTTRGFLPPRMTTAQRDAIATPPNGLVLYNTSTDKLQVRAAGAWTDLH
jgi:hypothetical protein